MFQKPLTLIKLGGSIITNKDIPKSLREDVLKRLVGEIARAIQERPDEQFIIGHGQGSYAHVPAQQYKTMDGFVNSDSRFGMALVLDDVGQLNRIVVNEFIRHHIPAVSFYASNTIITAKRSPHHASLEVLEQYLESGLIPITCGDVLTDKKQGCTIWSCEEVLSFFATYFHQKDRQIKQIIHVTEVPGYLDDTGKIVPEITNESWKSLRSSLKKTKGFDVTGGMSLKIEESLYMAKLGIESKIISGLEKNNLYNALTQKAWIGTTVKHQPVKLKQVGPTASFN